MPRKFFGRNFKLRAIMVASSELNLVDNMDSLKARQLSRSTSIEWADACLYTLCMITPQRLSLLVARSLRLASFDFSPDWRLQFRHSAGASIRNGPSEDEETKISREFRREAKKFLKFVNHPEVERYVDRIGRRILAATGPQSFDYRFFVVEDPQLNAFAVPGGSIYCLHRTDRTGEDHRRTRRRARSRNCPRQRTSYGTLLGAGCHFRFEPAGFVALARTGSGAQAAGMVGQAVAATRQLAYSRQLEMEADTLGTRYMAAAGYDPKGTLAFLKMLIKNGRLIRSTCRHTV